MKKRNAKLLQLKKERISTLANAQITGGVKTTTCVTYTYESICKTTRCETEVYFCPLTVANCHTEPGYCAID
ncbi:hypothetical protein C8N46_10352 [Kordia periserrulae]|uniref:Uncharacterized protein n=1 Tax=Kordia periserrulae TaxID=701523 RepID=A0A2T6C0W0_9FLAO|nr:hypothetical protein [Kordia periserrulae]PTX61955.1 hypothetical protein C8N46_10352 [Kordia periserrulae]